jgi:uncharacterized protein YlxW (UPF0749 family)
MKYLILLSLLITSVYANEDTGKSFDNEMNGQSKLDMIGKNFSQINSLSAQVNELKSRISTLESRLNALENSTSAKAKNDE